MPNKTHTHTKKKARPERPPYTDLKVLASEEGREREVYLISSRFWFVFRTTRDPCVTAERKQRREKEEDVDVRDSKFETLFGKEKSEMRATSARVEKKRPDELIQGER